MLWLWLLLAGAALAAVVLARLPEWLSATLIVMLLLITTLVMVAGSAERAVSPLLLVALGMGMLIPVGNYAQRSGRVAPSRRKRLRAQGAMQAANHTPVALEGINIPDYEVLEKVGSGGMASVYKARHKSDNAIVALKIPMEQYVADAKFIRRFHREAEVAQRLNHQNIVRTFEHGSIGVKHYMVMEYVDGRSLESYVEMEELTLEVSIEIMRFVVAALQHIHSAGIIHRDIKPANIMILKGGVQPDAQVKVANNAVKLMDFGVAGGKVLSRLTMTGARVGTPIYMSPEQARGMKIDHRSDIYSLGLVFYEMLTGQTAFRGGYEAIVHQQIFQTPPPPRQIKLDIPKPLDSLIMQMIAKDPDDRPRLEEVYKALDLDALQSELEDIDLPCRLVLTVNARQGVLRLLDTEGNLHSSLGDIGSGEGNFSAAPLSVTVDSAGNFYVSIFEYNSGDNNRMIHKLSPAGKPLLTFGRYGMKPGELLYPSAIAVASDNSIYVLDSETCFVQRFSPEGRYLAHFGGRGQGKGRFSDPKSLVIDRRNLLYVLDYGNRQIQSFRPDGTFERRWAFKIAANKEGIRLLDGFAVDQHGNIYISDSTGGKIRKISPQGKVTTSYAVDPMQGEEVEELLDLGVDDEGYLYAARRGGHAIRKYDTSGRLLATLETYAPVVQMVVDIHQVLAATPPQAKVL